MAESIDMNGTRPKPGHDVNTGDRVQLIAESVELPTHMSTDVPSSPGDTVQVRSEMSPLQLECEEAEKSRKKTHEGLKIIIITSVMFAVSVTVALIVTIFLGPPAVPPHGAVACDVQECADIGVALMKAGGGAVDAAVATVLCLGVVNPHHSGIGGGAFLVIRDHRDNKSVAIDARETAPSGTSSRMDVGVPGELRGLQAAHKQFGKLSWAKVVDPVAKLARDGFNISHSLAHAIESIEAGDTDLVELFYRDGNPLVAGSFMTRPDLADMLETLGSDGVDAFYENLFASEVEQNTNGHITEGDVLDYTALKKETLKGSINNKTVETMPAPGGGPLLLFVLNVMEGYISAEDGNRTDELYYHRLIETLKFMEAQRPMFEDPGVNNTLKNVTDKITSKDYAKYIRSLISDDQTQPADYYQQTGGFTPDHGTAQVSVIGPNEDFVSITSSLNNYFGSRLVTPSGIILNNQLADFSVPTGDPNQKNLIAADKRPQSSMTPTVVHMYSKPCASRAALGGINGSRIIAGVAEVILNMFAFGQSAKDAVDAPRVNAVLEPDRVEYDQSISEDILDSLRDKGHTDIQFYERGVDLVNVVAKINETISAQSDTSRTNDGGMAEY